MTTIVNTDQAAAWNGYEGAHWADNATRYDAVNDGFNEAILSAVRPADRVIDIGCGAGRVTRLAAARAGAPATGLDLSGPMLARARDLATGMETYHQGDAQVHPLPAGAYDLAVSRFGIMFFADPVAAFANIGRALRPGGRITMLSMRGMAEHDMGAVLADAAEHLPWFTDDADDHGPLSLSRPEVIHDVFTAAGYTDVTAEPVDAMQHWGADAADAGAFLGDWGPVRHLLSTADAAVAAATRAQLVASMARYTTPDGVLLRAAAWRISAVRP